MEELNIPNFETFRHVTNTFGKLTIYCQVFPTIDKMNFGLAFCAPTDDFNKVVGRKIAKNRCDSNPISITYNPYLTLLENVLLSVKSNLMSMKVPEWFFDCYKLALIQQWTKMGR